MDPICRELPATAGFSLLHQELYEDMLRLVSQLDLAVANAEQRSIEFRHAGDEVRAKLALASPEAQMYSRAVQVFAAMAVEAALNCYGLMWFGEAGFEKYFKRCPTVPKLKKLAKICAGKELNDTDEIVRLASSLMVKRNAHVHPRAEESSPDAQGVFRIVTQKRQPRRYPSAGHEAAAELNRFLELFAGLDRRTASFFLPRAV